jgi:hypothetical protein
MVNSNDGTQTPKRNSGRKSHFIDGSSFTIAIRIGTKKQDEKGEVKEEVRKRVEERAEVPEGETARHETVLSPRDESARPIMGTVLSSLARSARPGMVLPPLVQTTPSHRWKREWQERFGAQKRRSIMQSMAGWVVWTQ